MKVQQQLVQITRIIQNETLSAAAVMKLIAADIWLHWFCHGKEWREVTDHRLHCSWLVINFQPKRLHCDDVFHVEKTLYTEIQWCVAVQQMLLHAQVGQVSGVTDLHGHKGQTSLQRQTDMLCWELLGIPNGVHLYYRGVSTVSVADLEGDATFSARDKKNPTTLSHPGMLPEAKLECYFGVIHTFVQRMGPWCHPYFTKKFAEIPHPLKNLPIWHY